MLDKEGLIAQLVDRFEAAVGVARRAEADAREGAETMATEAEKREDGRVALEFGALAQGHAGRTRRARAELEALLAFKRRGLPRYGPSAPVGLGALVDVESDGDEGKTERTLFVLPAGAGTELTGPDGDGFLSVITPESPVGRALLGKRRGDSFDVAVRGEWFEWRVLDVG